MKTHVDWCNWINLNFIVNLSLQLNLKKKTQTVVFFTLFALLDDSGKKKGIQRLFKLIKGLIQKLRTTKPFNINLL